MFGYCKNWGKYRTKTDQFHSLVMEVQTQGGKERGQKEGRLKREQFPTPT